MKIAFYVAKHGNWLDKLIAWWTRPNFWKFWQSGMFSHCELLFSDGVCFGASPRENCCRFKTIEMEEDHWVLIQLDNSYDERCISTMCIREENKPYDYIGVFLTFVVPFDYNDKYKWFCSELIAKIVFRLDNANRYSPNSLYQKIQKYFI